MKASVIAPLFNCEDNLPEFWEALKSQNYNLKEIEFVFVDNNSSDNTYKMLLDIKKENPELKIEVLLEKNIQSSYAARNKAIKNSSAELILMIDGDCIADQFWISSIINFFEANDIDVVAGQILSHKSNSLIEEFSEKNKFLSQSHTLAHNYMPYGQTANLAIRRSVFKKIHLFRPHLTSGGDADICWRYVKEYEKEILLLESARVFHIHRTNLTELKKQWMRYGSSHKFLKELHPLGPRKISSWLFFARRLAKWLFVEVPTHAIKTPKKVDFLNTPLQLLCIYFSDRGYIESQFENKFSEIELYD